MPSKVYDLPAIGKVTVTKRKTNRNIRLSLTHAGEIKVSIPAYAPYIAGLNFAANKSTWIIANRPAGTKLTSGQVIAGKYYLKLVPDNVDVPASYIKNNLITVRHPGLLTAGHPSVQKCAFQACIRAIRVQAETRLPARLYELAGLHAISYSQLSIKRLSRRWGSCDQKNRLVLNLFLVQLPDELIDYVILHELAHTKVLNHSNQFWQYLATMDPATKTHRRQLRSYHPGILPD